MARGAANLLVQTYTGQAVSGYQSISGGRQEHMDTNMHGACPRSLAVHQW